MGIAIVLLLVVFGFSIMSKISKVVFLAILSLSLIYGYSVSYHVNGIGPDTGQVKNIWNLYGVNIGIFVVGALLGIIRHFSSDSNSYAERKKRLLVFLLKWGAIYSLFSIVSGKIIDEVTGEDSLGFVVMKLFGPTSFVVLLVVFYGVRFAARKKTAPPVSSESASKRA